MALARGLLTLGTAFALSTSAIAGTKDFALQGHALPADKPVTVVLMRPSVDVGELQGGGLAEPNADWTEAARTNIEAALRAHFTDKQIDFVVMEQQLKTIDERRIELLRAAEMELVACEGQQPAPGVPDDAVGSADATASADTTASDIVVCAQEKERVTELESERFALGPFEKQIADYNTLHEAVVGAILSHKYGYGDSSLPTKKNRFEYTLGPGTSDLGAIADANYGLFMLTYDQFASDSRKAMQVLGGLGCLIGACMIITGGQHIAYVSLVELETGNIVWFNLLRGSKGDVREAEGAQNMIDAIMVDMPSRPGERTASAGEEES